MANRIPPFLLTRSGPGPLKRGSGKIRVPFLERGMDHLAGVIRRGFAQCEISYQDGFFQKIDARVKVLFLLFFVLIVSLKRDLLPEICILLFVFVLTLFSRLGVIDIYKRVLFWGVVFGFMIALPSAFNVITKGEIILPIATLSRSRDFWIYHLPAEIGITREGMVGVAMLTARVMNSLSLSFLVLYTTPFHEIIRALKVLRVPDSFLLIITLCYKYIFIFSKTVEEMHLARKCRIVRELKNTEAREWVAGRIAVIFGRTRTRCEEIFKAMTGRGFSDTIKVYGFKKMRTSDWGAAIFLFLTGILFLFI